jgi:hypothetical protein
LSDQPIGIKIDPNHPDVLDPTLVIPESLVVIVEEHAEASPLSGYLERFGGYQGTVEDMFGQQRAVSFEQWKDADPETTLVSVQFRYLPSDKGRLEQA